MKKTWLAKPDYIINNLERMNTIFKLCLFLCCFPLITQASSNIRAQVNFVSGSLSDIQRRAASEDKPYFIHFTAEWCMPCQWMEKNTYTDPELANYVNTNYIPYKVDIDDSQGFNYKEQFKILLLPSVLIFSASGDQLDRFEESLSATKMLLILKAYKNPGNNELDSMISEMENPPSIIYPEENNEPFQPIETIPSEEEYFIEESPEEPAPSRYTHYEAPPQPEKIVEAPPKRVYTSQPKDKLPPRPTVINHTESGPPKQGYGVQIGAFSNIESVKKEARKFEKRFGKPVNVYPIEAREKTIYKMVIGVFSSKTQANQYMSFLKSKSINGFVKNLANF